MKSHPIPARVSLQKRAHKLPDSTSIGDIFWLEINAIRLCGAFMLDERFNWYIGVGYKIFALVMVKLILDDSLWVYDRVVVQSKAENQNMRIFLRFGDVAFLLVVVCCSLNAIRSRNFICILLRKRIKVKKSNLGGRAQIGQGDNELGQISRVSIARVHITCYVLLAGFLATLRAYYAQRHYPTEQVASGSWAKVPSKILLACNIRDLGAMSSVSDSSSNSLEPSLEFFGPMFAQLFVNLAFLLPIYLKKTAQLSFALFSIYGQMLITLFMSVFMSDLLRDARQRTEAHLDEDYLNDMRKCSNRNTSVCAQQLENSTDLLIQVREVLIALRSIMRNEYLFFYLVDNINQMIMFSRLISFIACDQYGWAALICLELLLLIMGIIEVRIAHSLVRREAQTFGAHMERHLYERDVKHHSQSSNSRSRLRAILNYRLAMEIERLWPTDWLNYDLRSLFAEIAFNFTFVAGLYQLIDASSRLAAQRTNHAAIEARNSTVSISS